MDTKNAGVKGSNASYLDENKSFLFLHTVTPVLKAITMRGPYTCHVIHREF